jgi:hypothetical protein
MLAVTGLFGYDKTQILRSVPTSRHAQAIVAIIQVPCDIARRTHDTICNIKHFLCPLKHGIRLDYGTRVVTGLRDDRSGNPFG